MRYFVIDASVVLKSLLEESSNVMKRFANLLRAVDTEEVVLLSTKLLPIEVANGFRFTIKDKTESVRIFKDFLRLPIKTLVLSELQKEESLKTSYDLATTVYDTSYHILAKSHGAVFLTCDENYYSKAKILGDIELIS